MTVDQFFMYQSDWIGTFEAAGRSREECINWMKERPSYCKPRIKIKMGRQPIPMEET